ncbi:hypothetical protein [Chitinophaga qingshengii]|uniref:Ankyrin repeat domain-containing protein n=1 Tax=Chitinophaga qingshengii TaxID=1569794 RepID=A0ABR7TRR5_9BACT|nr:hypothetical protein [Chitinophaga qingshengii]MBC9933184.1 hypothetical protein [Chitinophaga qingshengii]
MIFIQRTVPTLLLLLCFVFKSPAQHKHAEAWIRAIDSGDSTQLLQLVKQGYRTNVIISSDSIVHYGTRGNLPVRLTRYTPLSYIMDDHKTPGNHFSDGCSPENNADCIQHKKAAMVLLLVQHGYRPSVEDLELLLLAGFRSDQFRAIVRQGKANVHGKNQSRLVAAAIWGNCEPALSNWLTTTDQEKL